MSLRIGIIGGGAAGFFAAISAAEALPTAEVVILEGSKKLLSKVLISGGGRCNVTHNCLDTRQLVKNYPRGSKELLGPFSRFAVADTVAWFNSKGVQLKTESDNRMFPVTDSSETISKCLIDYSKKLGITVRTTYKVSKILRKTEGFEVFSNNQQSAEFDRIIICSGGSKNSFKLAGDLGHQIVSPVPSLFTFEINDPLIAGLAGLSFPRANLKLNIDSQKFETEGPMLVTHWGLSGPAVIKLSALAARELHQTDYHTPLRVCFSEISSIEKARDILTNFKSQHGKKQFSSINDLFDLPKRFWQNVLRCAGVSDTTRLADCSAKQLTAISKILTEYELLIIGKGVFKEEFVTAGGVELKQVDFKTMESKLVSGLFFAGEVLNIDGVTGGFNFQSAWTTGWIAGASSVC